jgi:hypothetical protein
MTPLGFLLAQQDNSANVGTWNSGAHNLIFLGVFVIVCIAVFIWWLKRNA